MDKDTQVQNIKAAILEPLEERDGRTFSELDSELSELEEFFDIEGDMAWCYRGNRNLILWCGMSEAYVQALHELMHEKLVYTRNTSMLTYLTGSKMLNFPIATSWDREYRRPHWMPTVLCKMTPEKLKEFGDKNEIG